MARYVFSDRVPLSCVDLPDGSMVATGTLASVGVMSYPWGREAVGWDCLSDDTWIRTAHSPIVLEHPPGEGAERFLSPENTSKYSAPGYDGPGKIIPGAVRVWPDAEQQVDKIEVRVYDDTIAEGIRRGMYELSPGYLTPDIDTTPGSLNGEPYDTRQRKRVGNHVALILKKEFGGRGGRGAEARFDAGESGTTGGADMDPEQVKQMIAEAIAAYKAEDEGKDKALISEMIKEAIGAIKGGGGDDMAAKMDEMGGRLAKMDEAMARYDAFMVAGKEKSEDPERTDEAEKPGEKHEEKKEAEDEARMDAADEAAVLKLAGARGLDSAQPVAKLRALLLEGSGYEQKPRRLQRVYVGELAKHARTDAADPFGFVPLPVVHGGQPRVLQDRASRLEQRGKK